MTASGTPWLSSSTVSRSGQRVASIRRRNSTRSSSGKLTSKGRIAAAWVAGSAGRGPAVVLSDIAVPPHRAGPTDGHRSITRDLRLHCGVDSVLAVRQSLVGAGRRSHPPVASATGQSGLADRDAGWLAGRLGMPARPARPSTLGALGERGSHHERRLQLVPGRGGRVATPRLASRAGHRRTRTPAGANDTRRTACTVSAPQCSRRSRAIDRCPSVGRHDEGREP